MQIEIWSDIVCPWCYIGKRRFEQALASFEQRAGVAVVWRSFELDPSAPRSHEAPLTELLAAKYGVPLARAEAMTANVEAEAAKEGLAYQLGKARSGNTFDAHRLMHLAAAQGLGEALLERLMHAYFSEGAPIGDHETLARLSAEAGLDGAAVRAALAGDDYAAAVRADEARAMSLGVGGVPFFVINGQYGVSGAQPAEVLLGVLQEAWARSEPQAGDPPVGPRNGAEERGAAPVCADESCAI